MRAMIAVLALACLGLAAVPALADTPKQGVFIDSPKGVQLAVTKARTAIKSFQASCFVKSEAGALVQSSTLYLGTAARIKVNRKGRFSYNAGALLSSSPKPYPIKLKITGRFTGGKAKGSYETATTGVTCVPTTFSAKYYGVNPQG